MLTKLIPSNEHIHETDNPQEMRLDITAKGSCSDPQLLFEKLHEVECVIAVTSIKNVSDTTESAPSKLPTQQEKTIEKSKKDVVQSEDTVEKSKKAAKKLKKAAKKLKKSTQMSRVHQECARLLVELLGDNGADEIATISEHDVIPYCRGKVAGLIGEDAAKVFDDIDVV